MTAKRESTVPFEWTASAVAKLRRLHKAGLTMRAIAEKIGAPSRNSVIGKSYRLGLKRKEGAPSIEAPPMIAQQKIIAPIVARKIRRPVKLLNLKIDDCRWPIGNPKDKDFYFCGSPRARGPYCAKHAEIAYLPRIEKKTSRRARQ